MTSGADRIGAGARGIGAPLAAVEAATGGLSPQEHALVADALRNQHQDRTPPQADAVELLSGAVLRSRLRNCTTCGEPLGAHDADPSTVPWIRCPSRRIDAMPRDRKTSPYVRTQDLFGSAAFWLVPSLMCGLLTWLFCFWAALLTRRVSYVVAGVFFLVLPAGFMLGWWGSQESTPAPVMLASLIFGLTRVVPFGRFLTVRSRGGDG